MDIDAEKISSLYLSLKKQTFTSDMIISIDILAYKFHDIDTGISAIDIIK